MRARLHAWGERGESRFDAAGEAVVHRSLLPDAARRAAQQEGVDSIGAATVLHLDLLADVAPDAVLGELARPALQLRARRAEHVAPTARSAPWSGVQPFGRGGLSSTGPKAGGPQFLPRFAPKRTLTVNTAAIGGVTELLSRE
ncbi:MAG TPA: hypothetical protein VMM77_00135 [Gemmatimonadaceae bacterium]|nr:hypothetical protein [Gemmatimonadaceae bacterium]